MRVRVRVRAVGLGYKGTRQNKTEEGFWIFTQKNCFITRINDQSKCLFVPLNS